jgi:hypothetical protein
MVSSLKTCLQNEIEDNFSDLNQKFIKIQTDSQENGNIAREVKANFVEKISVFTTRFEAHESSL